MRRWHRKCAKAFAPMRMLSGFVRRAWPHIKDPNPYSHNWHIEVLCQEYDVLNQVLLSSRRQAVNGCMPKQMMTGPESGESYAQAVASGASPRFVVIDEHITNADSVQLQPVQHLHFRHTWDGGTALSSATSRATGEQ